MTATLVAAAVLVGWLALACLLLMFVHGARLADDNRADDHLPTDDEPVPYWPAEDDAPVPYLPVDLDPATVARIRARVMAEVDARREQQDPVRWLA